MNHDKELTLIKTLLNKGVINQQEVEKAELYLSLSSTTFDNYPDAIQWLIHNRAVSRDRQEQVKNAFEYSGLTDADMIPESSKPEPIAVPASSYSAPEPIKEPARSVQNTTSNTYSAITVPNDIYQYNLRALKAFDEKYGVPSDIYAQTENNLKSCPYLFCHQDEIGNWISSYFIEPVDLDEEDELIDSVTALQLYKLVTEQEVIAPTEYDCCYWELLDSDVARPFRNETLLSNWLKEQGCILSDDEVITLPADNMEHNQALVKKLVQSNLIKKGELLAIFTLLAKHPELRFESEQRLLSWIKSQKIVPRKKKFPLFFVLFAAFIVYKILSSVITSNYDDYSEAEHVSTVMPAEPAENSISGSFDADAIAKMPATENDVTIAIQSEQDRYEIALEQALDKLNATIRKEQGASSATFADIVRKIERTSNCSTKNQIISCQFKIYYYYHPAAYTITVQFKDVKGNVQLVSEQDFTLALIDGIVKQQ